MMVALVCGLLLAVVCLMGCVPPPSRYFHTTSVTKNVDAKGIPLNVNGEPQGKSITVPALRITVSQMFEYQTPRWKRWRNSF